MKHLTFKTFAALALVATLSTGPAQAAAIDGSLNFGGAVTAIPGPAIGDAIGLSFTSGFLVTDATGTFSDAGIGIGDSGTLADFFFNPLMPSPVNPLLTILFDGGPGKFSFALESVEIVGQSDMFLALSGVGTLSGTGLDSTPYDISISVDGAGSLYAFSGTLAPTVVPVPGALILLMSGLAALGVVRRREGSDGLASQIER